MTDAGGKAVTAYNTPSTLVTIGDGGYLDWSADDEIAYQPGCMLYYDAKQTMSVINGVAAKVKTTDEFKARWAKPWSRLLVNFGGFQMPPALPEAYTTDNHLIVLGDSSSSQLVRILQAAELPMQYVDAKYPGPGKALLSFIWSPFAVEKNVILLGASDEAGLNRRRGEVGCIGRTVSWRRFLPGAARRGETAELKRNGLVRSCSASHYLSPVSRSKPGFCFAIPDLDSKFLPDRPRSPTAGNYLPIRRHFWTIR